MLYYGSCGFVLTKYNFQKFINVGTGTLFGTTDILKTLIEHNLEVDQDWDDVISDMLRLFTVQVDKDSVIFNLTLKDLQKMRKEFQQEFTEIFESSPKILEKLLILKLFSIEACEKQLK